MWRRHSCLPCRDSSRHQFAGATQCRKQASAGVPTRQGVPSGPSACATSRHPNTDEKCGLSQPQSFTPSSGRICGIGSRPTGLPRSEYWIWSKPCCAIPSKAPANPSRSDICSQAVGQGGLRRNTDWCTASAPKASISFRHATTIESCADVLGRMLAGHHISLTRFRNIMKQLPA